MEVSQVGEPDYETIRLEEVIRNMKRRWEEEVPIQIPAGERYISLGQEHITDGRELAIDTRNPKFYPIRIRLRPSMKEMVILRSEHVPCGTTFDVIEVNCKDV